MGFKIGGHTMTHRYLTRVNKEDARWEIEGCKKVIEQITGKKVDWFCYPRGYYSKKIIRMIKRAGYKYARTVKFEDGTNYEKAGIHLTYPREEYKGKDPFEVAKSSKLNHFWGHCFEIQRYNLWSKFEEFLIWYHKNKVVI